MHYFSLQPGQEKLSVFYVQLYLGFISKIKICFKITKKFKLFICLEHIVNSNKFKSNLKKHAFDQQLVISVQEINLVLKMT